MLPHRNTCSILLLLIDPGNVFQPVAPDRPRERVPTCCSWSTQGTCSNLLLLIDAGNVSKPVVSDWPRERLLIYLLFLIYPGNVFHSAVPDHTRERIPACCSWPTCHAKQAKNRKQPHQRSHITQCNLDYVPVAEQL